MADRVSGPPLTRVGIVGLGLVGGSIALALRSVQPDIHIIGVDDAQVMEAALRRATIDEARDSAMALADVDLIVLAAPVGAILEIVEQLGRAGVSAVVTDVGSTKRRVLEAAQRSHLENFIGGHPMAGSERAGLDAASGDLFRGKTWFVVPGHEAAPDAAALVDRFVRLLGAVPVTIAPDAHDRNAAYLSHLPQLLAVWLIVTSGDAVGEGGLKYAGRGFDEMTRLAASSSAVWQSIIATNADYITEALHELVTIVPQVLGVDAARLRDVFARANQWRDRLEEERGRPR
jgi:prephenate dehydrogenase